MYWVLKYKAVLIILLWHDGNDQITKDLRSKYLSGIITQKALWWNAFLEQTIHYQQDQSPCLRDQAPAVQGDQVMMDDDDNNDDGDDGNIILH